MLENLLSYMCYTVTLFDSSCLLGIILPSSRVPRNKIKITELLSKFPTLRGTRRFIFAFIGTRLLTI